MLLIKVKEQNNRWNIVDDNTTSGCNVDWLQRGGLPDSRGGGLLLNSSHSIPSVVQTREEIVREEGYKVEAFSMQLSNGYGLDNVQ